MLIAQGLVVILLAGGLVLPSAVECSRAEILKGICPGISNSGGSVDLSGSQSSGGGSKGGGNSNSGGKSNVGGGSGGQGDDSQAEAAMRKQREREECLASAMRDRCDMNYEVVLIQRDQPAAPVIPAEVTLNDIASFTPARPALSGEPAGLGVVGMPTNVVASASTQTLAGTLFTFPVTVTFVPSAFRFNFGDGTVLTNNTGGTSWASLGQADFTPTSTSHTYSARGTYVVTATTLYSATVDFGGGEIRQVPGYVEATTGGYNVRIVEVHTGLVDKTCLENPSGPGC